jgi:hypothetical protein
MKTKFLPLAAMAAILHLQASPDAPVAPDAVREDYVAHEWGTFTSVQGADGVQISWNPLLTTELPGFVYDRTKRVADPRRRFANFAGKTALLALQRMETPVIYFYSDKERTVDVTVKFPQGVITEWYPQAEDVGPSMVAPNRVVAAVDQAGDRLGLPPGARLSVLDPNRNTMDSRIRWAGVHVAANGHNEAKDGALLQDGSGSHYYAARETDASLLSLGNGAASGPKSETERFLFYRGIGNFRAPLTVKLEGIDADSLTLENTGKEELRHLFIYQVKDGRAKFSSVDRLSPQENRQVRLHPNQGWQPLETARTGIAEQIREALAEEGLYAREAAAMVKTWDDSWFAEQGVRVLYTLPRAWTDRVLPLTLKPAPRDVVRVMVGRAEVITPQMEWSLLKEITRFCDGDDATRARAIANVRQLGLGRFTEPALQRLLKALPPNREFNTLSWELLEAVSKADGAGKPKTVARN